MPDIPPPAELYSKRYSDQALPEQDWLVNRRALAQLVREQLQLNRGDRLLDIGADDGFFLRALAPEVAEAIGVDINTAAAADSNQLVRQMDATRLTFADGAFTKLYASHTVEHIPNLAAAMAEAARVLVPGGLALFIYPWELWRGMAAMRSSMKLTGNPFRAREFHVHKLSPRSFARFWSGAPFLEVRSWLIWKNTPQWVTLLKRNEA